MHASLGHTQAGFQQLRHLLPGNTCTIKNGVAGYACESGTYTGVTFGLQLATLESSGESTGESTDKIWRCTKHYSKAFQVHRAHIVCSLRLRSLSALYYVRLVIQQQLLIQINVRVVSAIHVKQELYSAHMYIAQITQAAQSQAVNAVGSVPVQGLALPPPPTTTMNPCR